MLPGDSLGCIVAEGASGNGKSRSRIFRIRRLPARSIQSKEEGPPCGSPFLWMVEVAGVLRPIPAFALWAIRCANVRFGFLPAQSNPACSPPSTFNPSKRKGPPCGSPFFGWWRWRESNPRPKAIDAQYYMLSSLFDLVFRQYSVRNAPVDQSEKFRPSSVRRRNQAIS